MTGIIGRAIGALKIGVQSEEVIREQYRTLTRMIPFLYTI